MAIIFIYTLASVLIVSFISFIGIFTLALKPDFLKRITMLLVSLSAGTLLGGAFFHLLPEILESDGENMTIWFLVIGGILVFFILEKIIHWRHCHIPTSDEHPHHLGKMNLVGDGLHNFIDGAIIAGAFLVNPSIGLATTIAVIAHEIPQEIGDFGVLIHAGYQRRKALLLNFLMALTAVVGAVVTLLAGNKIGNITSFIIPFTAGSFIYISTADLIPELKKEVNFKTSFNQLLFIIAGIAIAYLLKLLPVG